MKTKTKAVTGAEISRTPLRRVRRSHTRLTELSSPVCELRAVSSASFRAASAAESAIDTLELRDNARMRESARESPVRTTPRNAGVSRASAVISFPAKLLARIGPS